MVLFLARFGALGMQRHVVATDEARLLVGAAGNLDKVEMFVVEPGCDLHRVLMA